MKRSLFSYFRPTARSMLILASTIGGPLFVWPLAQANSPSESRASLHIVAPNCSSAIPERLSNALLRIEGGGDLGEQDSVHSQTPSLNRQQSFSFITNQERIEQLARADARANREYTLNNAYEALQGRIGIPESSPQRIAIRSTCADLDLEQINPENILGLTSEMTPQSSRSFLLELARRAAVKDLSPSLANQPETASRNLATAIAQRLRRYRTLSEQIQTHFRRLNIPTTPHELWNLTTSITNIHESIAASDFAKRLNRALTQGIRKGMTFEQATTALRDTLEIHAREAIRGQSIAMVEMSQTPRINYQLDSNTVNALSADAERARQSGHTLSGNGLGNIHRHITPEVMTQLANDPQISIHVYDGQEAPALAELQRAGFTQILRLSRNKFTDFDSFMAHNPNSGETRYVAITPLGRSYRRDVAAHFLYYQNGAQRIAGSRVQIHANPELPRAEFARTLETHHINPDVIVMGNLDQTARVLRERGITPSRVINEPGVFGQIFTINGKEVLVMKVEPGLFGDRAGEFIRAALARPPPRHRSVLFTGTAGSINRNMVTNDIVVPSTFGEANGPSTNFIFGVQNRATAFTQRSGYGQRPGVHTGSRLGAVDTIMTEDRAWLQSHATGPGNLDVVEQEGAGIAEALRDYNRYANSNHTSPVDFYGYYRISDEVGTEHDFTQNEGHRPTSRSGLDQSHFTLGILNDALGGLPNSLPSTGAVSAH